MSELRVIDVHCHYQKADGFLEEQVSSARAAGVEKICLNGGGERWNQHGNDGVMKAAEAHPDTVIPFAFVYLGEHEAADVRAWQRAGFRGLKTQCPAAMYDDEAFFPIYQAAEELALPVLFHTGISARRVPDHDRWDTSSRYMMPMTLDRIARCFPDLTIWGAHLGVPDTWHAAMLMAVHPRVYFDICGLNANWTSILHWDEMLYRGEEHWGKLVFGTEGGPRNFAAMVERYRTLLTEHGVSEEVQHRVLWKNAAEALGLAPATD